VDDERGGDCRQIDTMKADDYEARILEPHEYSLWDDFAVQSPQGTIFHNSDYLQVVADSSSSKLRVYGCFKDDELVGGCSLFVKDRGRIVSHATSTGSLTPYGGFLLPDLDNANVRKSGLVQDGVISALCDSIQKDRYSAVTITNSPDLRDVRSCLWRGWEGRVAYTYYVDLDNFNLGNFSRDIKKNVKKAIKSGFYVENLRDAELHYDLTERVFQRQNLSAPFKKEFLIKLMGVIEKKVCGNMWVARDKSGETAASHIRIWDDKRVYALTAASDPVFRDSGANQFLFVSVLEKMQKAGFHQINMMHGNTQRLSYYAAGYNPTLVPYYSVTKRGFAYGMASAIYSAMRNYR